MRKWGGLPAQAELLDDSPIPLTVRVLEVQEEAAALADDPKQPHAGMVVLGVGLEMLGELVDALGKKSDLDFRGTGVLLVDPVIGDQPLLDFNRE
jgi:hypothetical protein